MDDYRAVLKRAGIVLIVIGLLDIGQMVYCIMNKISYSSSLNIIALIAGIFLYKGSLRATKYITRYIAFMLGGFFVLLVAIPFVVPFELEETYIKLHPMSVISSIIIPIIIVMILYWIYRQLISDVVIEAKEKEGFGNSKGSSELEFGAALAVLILGLALFMQHSEGAHAAMAKASSRFGPQYHYVVVGYSGSGSDSSYQLVAYNDHEIRNLSIELNSSDH